MENEPEILGYIMCKTCNEPKEIKQGRGKRKNFVYGRCLCGPDQRTGAAAQAEMRKYKPLESVKAEIEAVDKPNKPDTNQIQTTTQTKTEPKQIPDDTQKEEVNLTKCGLIGGGIGLLFGGAIRILS